MEDIKNYKGKTGSWTKYGGSRNNLQLQDLPDVWTCQSCGKKVSNNMSPYLHYLESLQMYLRVCAECYNEGCTLLKERMKNTP